MILFKKIYLLLFTASISMAGTGSAIETTIRRQPPRLIVLTDISSLSQNEAEPDDGQSMVRLMLYTNALDLEGLIATSNLGHGQRTRPELIAQVVAAYGKVRPNLLQHDEKYPSASTLAAIIKSGTPVAGPKVPVEETIGEGKDTEGSEWIIHVVDKKDPRPVWIVIWGGSADLAQALWKVRATRTAGELKEFISKLRVHMVYDQDSTGPWIKKEFPQLFCIFRHHGIRGMYRGGDTTLVRSRWVETNIRHNHGALGALYVNYRGGDIWGGKLGRVKGIKEGDTPSFLYLLDNGLNVPGHPEWGGWSGRFRKENDHSNLWTEAVDSVANFKNDMDPRMAALYRWRPAWQADFAARLDWCVKSYEEANHAPVFKKDDLEKRTVVEGRDVELTARVTDPDNDNLHYHWYFYPEVGSYKGALPALMEKANATSFTAPQVTRAETLHVVLEATDNGKPALTSYKRFVITVKPSN